MKVLTSCKAGIDECVENGHFAITHLYKEEKTMDMHIHNCYEMYYSISGGKQFLIHNRIYDIKPGDLFFINEFESHHITEIDDMIHERIVIFIHPDFLKEISTKKTDLSYCFTNRSQGFSHRISLNKESQQRFLYFIDKITSPAEFGSDIIEKTSIMEMMVNLNALFMNNNGSQIVDSNFHYNNQIEKILTYINQNIHQDITVEHLANQFYISTSYICRIFKAATGTTINKYITARRIAIAKSLLARGLGVNEVCEKCGFNDYSNFLKTFTKSVGLSPKKYAQQSVS